MSKIIFHVPRNSLSGGNIVTLELCKYLQSLGFEVKCFNGIKFIEPNNVVLISRNKGKINTVLNIFAFFTSSLVSLLFHSKTVSTHHLTSIFSFFRPTKYALIQDVEINFYPLKYRNLFSFFWKNYLKAPVHIYTNPYLEDLVSNGTSKHCKGVIIPGGLGGDYSSCNKQQIHRVIDFVLILRNGEYKSFECVLNLFFQLVEQKYKVVLVNQSNYRFPENYDDHLMNSVNRVEFLKLLAKSKCYICLSEYEGLGLPNIEAYLSGCSIVSTKIPSMKLLMKFSKRDLFALNTCSDVNGFDFSTVLEEYSCTADKLASRINNVHILVRQWYENYINNIFRN